MVKEKDDEQNLLLLPEHDSFHCFSSAIGHDVALIFCTEGPAAFALLTVRITQVITELSLVEEFVGTLKHGAIGRVA